MHSYVCENDILSATGRLKEGGIVLIKNDLTMTAEQIVFILNTANYQAKKSGCFGLHRKK
jgi:hypothetical protein